MSKNFSDYALIGTSLIAGLALTACSAGSNKLPILNDLAMSGTAADGYVSVAKTSAAKIEDVKKLVIPAFNVTYKLKVDGTAVTKTMQAGQEVTTSIGMKVNMEDANVAMMQWLTNKAYNIFVAELEKANFEVVALDSVAKSDAYYQINHKNLATSVAAEDKSITLVADGLKFYDHSAKIDPDGGFMMGVANINSAVNGDLVEEFGGQDNGVAVLNVNMAVQFGNFDLEDHQVSEIIPFNPSFTIIGSGTNLEVITEFKGVSMPGRDFYMPEESVLYSLKQDMGSKTNVIAGMLDVSSSEGAKEYNATINVTGFEKAGVEQIESVSKLFATAMTTSAH